MTSIIKELTRQRDALDKAIAALSSADTGVVTTTSAVTKSNSKAAKASGKRKLSAEGRARIIEAAKKRWARVAREKKSAAKKGTAKKSAPKKAAPKKTKPANLVLG